MLVLVQEVRELFFFDPIICWHSLRFCGQSESVWIQIPTTYQSVTSSPYLRSTASPWIWFLRSIDVDNFSVVVLDQGVREFDVLELIKDWHSRICYSGSDSMWIFCSPLESGLTHVLDQRLGVCGFLRSHRRLTFLPCLCWISECVDLTSCCSLETDVPVVLVLDQDVRRFDSLLLIRDWHSCRACAGSVCKWIWLPAAHWRLMFLSCLCWISLSVDLTSRCSLETDVLAVLVLDQLVLGFDFLLPIGDWLSCCACAGSASAWFDFLLPIGDWRSCRACAGSAWFDFLLLIGDWLSCCACAGSGCVWIWLLADHWRLMFLLCLCWISECVIWLLAAHWRLTFLLCLCWIRWYVDLILDCLHMLIFSLHWISE